MRRILLSSGFFTKLIRCVQLGVFALVLICCHGQNFSFVFMSDLHLYPDSSVVKNYRLAIARINTLEPAFVIAGGDMIMNNPNELYESVIEQMQLVTGLNKDLLPRLYPVIGNHDPAGLYQPPAFSPDHPDFDKNLFIRQWQLGLYCLP